MPSIRGNPDQLHLPCHIVIPHQTILEHNRLPVHLVNRVQLVVPGVAVVKDSAIGAGVTKVDRRPLHLHQQHPITWLEPERPFDHEAGIATVDGDDCRVDVDNSTDGIRYGIRPCGDHR